MELNTETGGVILSAANPLAMEIDKIQQFANISEIEAFNLPSPHITPERMLELKEMIVKNTSNRKFRRYRYYTWHGYTRRDSILLGTCDGLMTFQLC